LDQVVNLYRRGLAQKTIKDSLKAMSKKQESFYKNYDAATDQQVFDTLIPFYMAQEVDLVVPALKKIKYNAGYNYTSWSNSVFKNSITADAQKMKLLLNSSKPADTLSIKSDPAYQIYAAVKKYNDNNIAPELNQYKARIQPLDRIYMKRQMEYLNSGRAFYPDANQTLRLSYGQVQAVPQVGYDNFLTNIDQLIIRHDAFVEEFNIPQKLRNLHAQKDYGRWAVAGTVPVNFLASNHTSGGNSGSPVLNDKGELIGINFDRIWQGTMSDIFYDPKICRNISVDIRYVLFIIEKFGNAGWLLEEMTLVK